MCNTWLERRLVSTMCTYEVREKPGFKVYFLKLNFEP
jgi:hypothetical protein